MISFGFTTKRRNLLLDIFNGKPGVVYPMDLMTRDASMSYAAAFGATLYLVYTVVVEQKLAFEYNGPDGFKSLVVIVSMLIYGMVFFPVFACLAIGSAYGYAIGSVYVWMFTALTAYEKFQCAHILREKNAFIMIAQGVPPLFCLLYLCCTLPGRCVITFRKGLGFFHSIQDQYQSETLEEIKQSYVGLHVIKLLRKPDPKPPPPEGMINTVVSKLKDIWYKVVYKSDKGFEYSSRFSSVMFMGLCLQYILTLKLYNITDLLDVLIDITEKVREFTDPILLNQEKNEISKEIYVWIDFMNKLTRASKVCFIVVMCLTCLLNIVSILHMMSSYRRNLKKLHRGDNSYIPPREKCTNDSLLVGSIRYAGYQVAYIVWGFLIQFAIILLFCLAITCLIVFLDAGISDWLLDNVKRYWPIVVSALVINMLQTLLAKFAFLQKRGKVLALKNRRMLFCFTYFMYFYNVFLGLVSCLLRIIKAILLGALLLPRLDNSTLPQRFQFFDPGFAAYVGFLHIENSHNHPVVLVFVRILMANCRNKALSTCLIEDNILSKGDTHSVVESRRNAARFNWQVFYTLIHNPELRLYRKGYLQALRKANKEGITVAVSDTLMSDPIYIVKQQKNEDIVTFNETEASQYLVSETKL